MVSPLALSVPIGRDWATALTAPVPGWTIARAPIAAESVASTWSADRLVGGLLEARVERGLDGQAATEDRVVAVRERLAERRVVLQVAEQVLAEPGRLGVRAAVGDLRHVQAERAGERVLRLVRSRSRAAAASGR